MPGLTDKIFLPISIFVLNIALGIFSFVLISAVGACFIVYARYGGEYANSVRWIRSAGYIEMLQTIRGTDTRKNIPGSVKWALVFGILATLGASILDKGIAAFVVPATRDGPSERIFLNTTQPTIYGFPQSFYGWNFFVMKNASVVDTIDQALRSPVVLRESTDGYRYTPITEGYGSGICDTIGLNVLQQREEPDLKGCAVVTPFSNIVNEQAKVSIQSPDRWSITMPPRNNSEPSYLSKHMEWKYLYGDGSSDEICTLGEDYQSRDWGGGFLAPVRTSTTKCLFEDERTSRDDLAMVTMTAVRFTDGVNSTRVLQDFLDDPSNELILAMEKTINAAQSTPLPSPPPGQPQNGVAIGLWAEFRIINGSIEFYACEEYNGFECVYGIINSIYYYRSFQYLKQVLDEGDLKLYGSTRYMTLEYFMDTTEVRSSDGKSMKAKFLPVSIDKMRSDNMAVANQMARIGVNQFADFGNMRFYARYDKAKIISGVEVPFWVLVAAGIILIVSFLLWQSTNLLIGSPYHSSLYSIIRSRLNTRSNDPNAKLMRVHLEQLTFEDVKLLPDLVERSSVHTNPSAV